MHTKIRTAAFCLVLLCGKAISTTVITYEGDDCAPDTVLGFVELPDQLCGTECTDKTSVCVDTDGARSLAFSLDEDDSGNLYQQVVGCGSCNSPTDLSCAYPDQCQSYPTTENHCFNLVHPNGDYLPTAYASITEFGCVVGDIPGGKI